MTIKFFVAFLATLFFVFAIFAISQPAFVFAEAADEGLPSAESFGVEDASGKSGTYVEVPVNILTVRDGPVQGIRLRVDYDESVLKMTSISKVDLTSKWTTRLGEDKHTIILATDNTGDAIPDGSSGSVVLLNFSVIGGDTSPMNLSFIELANSDGAVSRTVPARNGTFTVTSTGGYVTTSTTYITPSPSATATPTTSIKPSPSATATPTTSIKPSPSATPAPTTSIKSLSATPTTTPAIGGFEAIFAMTMLAILYLVSKRRTHKK